MDRQLRTRFRNFQKDPENPQALEALLATLDQHNCRDVSVWASITDRLPNHSTLLEGLARSIVANGFIVQEAWKLVANRYSFSLQALQGYARTLQDLDWRYDGLTVEQWVQEGVDLPISTCLDDFSMARLGGDYHEHFMSFNNPYRCRWIIARVLGIAAVPALLATLAGKSRSKQAQACERLSEMGPPSIAAYPFLLRAAKDSHPAHHYVRSHAISALSAYPSMVQSSKPVLLEALKNWDSSLAFSAKCSLERLDVDRDHTLCLASETSDCFEFFDEI